MKAIIKNVTGSADNEGLLRELSKDAGIKPGNIVTGHLSPTNNSFYFSVGATDCVAYPGQICELL